MALLRGRSLMSVAVGSPDQRTLEAGCNVYTLTGRPDDQGFLEAQNFHWL